MTDFATTQDLQALKAQVAQLQQLFQQHKHTQIDSLGIAPSDLVNASLYFGVKKVTLTSAQILALHSTPVTLIPAPGANAFVVVEAIDAKLIYNTIAYTGANNLQFKYTNGSGASVTADMANTFLNSSSTSYDHVAGVVTELTPATNAAVVVAVPTANPGAGNSTMTFTVKYRIINF